MKRTEKVNDSASSKPEPEPESASAVESSPNETETPEYLIPRMGKVGVGEPSYYRSLYILGSIPSEKPKQKPAGLDVLDKPINPFELDEGTDDLTLEPAFGVLTVHEQQWCQTGIALGNLLQSVCLAPGEVTQVAVTRWERKTSGTSSEITDQSEAVSDESEQTRAVNEVQRAVARETQQGSSSVSSSSSTAQAGGGWLFGSASGSTTTSKALTAQFSTGSRDLAAESTNAVAQSTAEKAQALRSRRQSVVREISEKEDETISTRVLANYNRRHSLNVLFFEVLQTYRITTRMSDWHRCLFVPMLPLNFSDRKVVERLQPQLLAILKEFDSLDIVGHLDKAVRESGVRGELQKQEACDERTRDLLHIKRIKQDYEAVPKERPSMQSAGIQEENWEYDRQMDALAGEYEPFRVKYALPAIAAPLRDMENAFKEYQIKAMESFIESGAILNNYRLFLNQQLWLRMSPYHVYRVLQKYSLNGKPVSQLVDPQPVGVFGNYLAFRWEFPLEDGGNGERDAFEATYIRRKTAGKADGQAKGEHEVHVALPTSGIFAEAVLGQGLAAEKIDPRFAKWGDKESTIPILPPHIADLAWHDRSKGMDFKTQDFAGSLAQLRAEKLADISHIDKIIEESGKGDIFRNMGGLEKAVELAGKLGELSEKGASEAGQRAVDLQKKVLDVFEKVIDSDAGQSALADAIAPGSGAALKGLKDAKGKATAPGKDGAQPAKDSAAPAGKEAASAAKK